MLIWTTTHKFVCEHRVLFLLYIRNKTTGSYGNSNHLRNCQTLSSKWPPHPFTRSTWGSLVFHILVTLVTVSFYVSHFCGCKVVSHDFVVFQFSWLKILNMFSCAFRLLVHNQWNNVYSNPLSIFFVFFTDYVISFPNFFLLYPPSTLSPQPCSIPCRP